MVWVSVCEVVVSSSSVSYTHLDVYKRQHQRPAVPGIRSTFGTGTELLNSLRLMYSRLASHRCPNGHYLTPVSYTHLGSRPPEMGLGE